MNGPHKTLRIVRRSERKRVCTPANFGSPRAFKTCEGSATPLVTISLTAACGLSWANALQQSSMNCLVLNMRFLLESVFLYYIVRPQQRIRKNTVIREALREIAFSGCSNIIKTRPPQLTRWFNLKVTIPDARNFEWPRDEHMRVTTV